MSACAHNYVYINVSICFAETFRENLSAKFSPKVSPKFRRKFRRNFGENLKIFAYRSPKFRRNFRRNFAENIFAKTLIGIIGYWKGYRKSTYICVNSNAVWVRALWESCRPLLLALSCQDHDNIPQGEDHQHVDQVTSGVDHPKKYKQ